MNAPAWRATLRIARREAWRNKGRSLLVIALIGLPVLVLAGADSGLAGNHDETLEIRWFYTRGGLQHVDAALRVGFHKALPPQLH